jgi:hypothetical protein
LSVYRTSPLKHTNPFCAYFGPDIFIRTYPPEGSASFDLFMILAKFAFTDSIFLAIAVNTNDSFYLFANPVTEILNKLLFSVSVKINDWELIFIVRDQVVNHLRL